MRKKIALFCFYIMLLCVSCVDNRTENNHEAITSKQDLRFENGQLIQGLGDGYYLRIGLESHANRYLPGCLKFLGLNKRHLNIVFNQDNVSRDENPLLNIHLTWWKKPEKPRFCAGVAATKGKHNKYAPNNVVFCYHSCKNSRWERIQEAFDQFRVAYFSTQIFGLSIVACSSFYYVILPFVAPAIIKMIAPEFNYLVVKFSGESLPPPQDLSEQLPLIECPNDVPVGTPLPHEFNPNLIVVARDSTGLHVIGNEADRYLFTQFYADPNPANLLATWIQGNWNGFSMGFEIPYDYNIVIYFGLSNNKALTIF